MDGKRHPFMFFCCCTSDDSERGLALCFDPHAPEPYEDKSHVAHSEECFRVVLSESTPLGLTLDCLDGFTALVNHVRSGGTVEAHNRGVQLNGRVTEQVRPGDYITEVNGFRQSAKMVEAMERGGGLEMTVVRPWQFLVSLTDGEESQMARPLFLGDQEPDVEPPCLPKRAEVAFWSQFTGSSCGMTVWGVQLSWAASGKSLLVHKVGSGPVLDWNKLYPERAIQRLDRIIAVNGVRAANGVETLLEQLQVRNCELLISRPGHCISPAASPYFSLFRPLSEEAPKAKGINKIVELWGRVDDQHVRTPGRTQKIEVCGLSSHEVEGQPTETDLLSRAAGRAANRGNSSNGQRGSGAGRPNLPRSIVEETASDSQVTASTTKSVLSVEEELPKVGDTLFYTAGRQRLENGDTLRFACRGRVVSLVARKAKAQGSKTLSAQFVEMLMEGNSQPICIRRNELSRNKPEMPTGWAVGDRVLYRGPERAVSSTDKLLPGLEGEVVGRAARRGDGKDDMRLSVHFDGHKLNTPIMTSAVKRA